MDLSTIVDGADRFVAYVEELTSVIGHADWALPLRDYCAVQNRRRSRYGSRRCSRRVVRFDAHIAHWRPRLKSRTSASAWERDHGNDRSAMSRLKSASASAGHARSSSIHGPPS